jgi:hypothetical protein
MEFDVVWSRLAIHGPLVLGLVAYWLAWALSLAPPSAIPRWNRARLIWTSGLVLITVHVLAVFHYIHAWDHDRAIAHTADKVAQMTADWGFEPWAFGEGLYFNYVFLSVWAIDVAWWWLAGHAAYARRPWLAQFLINGFLVFIVFQATVVFGYGAYRWVGLLAPPAVLIWGWLSSRPGPSVPSPEPKAV